MKCVFIMKMKMADRFSFGKINSLAFWTFTDVFEENGPGQSPFHGGFGLINVHGIKKPSYWAYWMLSKLGENIVEITHNSIMAKQGENYQVIIWNYCYYTDEFAEGDRSKLTLTNRDYVFEQKKEHIELSLDLHGEYEQVVYTLNESTSAFHNWVKMGAPQYPSQKQIEELKEKSQPLKEVRLVSSIKMNEILNPNEVKMFVLNKI